MKNLVGKIRAAVDKYNMISAGSNVAVAVSGGKDSVVLLSALAELKEYYPKKFDLIAITIDQGFDNVQTDYSSINNLCVRLKVPYIIERTNMYEIIFKERKEKNPCSLCARMRRGILHKIAKECGCASIALGHHMDDAVETFFMNLCNNGRIACFSPKSYLSKRDLWLIRPMIFCDEKKISSYANKYNLSTVRDCCPISGKTNRQKTKGIVSKLDKEYGSIQQKVIRAMMDGNIDDWQY